MPVTVLIKSPASAADVLSAMRENNLKFPVIAKPDMGERGFKVKKILNEHDVSKYLASQQFDFLIQEYVDLPLEFGVFYTRFPNSRKGHVTSIVRKEMLSVTGDGNSTLRELILNLDRAKLQWDTLSISFR
ncbi:MAG: hypothetical protein QM762_00035 [Chryseolinea sp.]